MDLYIIREITDDEIDRAVKVIREGFKTVAEDFGLTIDNCPTNGAFIHINSLKKWKSQGKAMYGLFIGSKMIGFLELDRKDTGVYELEKLTILPVYRHMGYGRILLSFAKEKAKELGAKKLCIGIIEENSVLKNWYSENGFVHTGTKKFDTLPFTVGFMEAEIK